jgi:antitoxin (DNA-binding transcriptional repressor) of toxin-antitoxin stability system
MKTLSVTEARANLGKLCESAKNGEEIGIVAGDTIFQLLPIEIRPVHEGEIVITPMTPQLVRKEYGVTADEWNRFKEREEETYKITKRKGEMITHKGKFDSSKFD